MFMYSTCVHCESLVECPVFLLPCLGLQAEQEVSGPCKGDDRMEEDKRACGQTNNQRLAQHYPCTHAYVATCLPCLTPCVYAWLCYFSAGTGVVAEMSSPTVSLQKITSSVPPSSSRFSLASISSVSSQVCLRTPVQYIYIVHYIHV